MVEGDLVAEVATTAEGVAEDRTDPRSLKVVKPSGSVGWTRSPRRRSFKTSSRTAARSWRSDAVNAMCVVILRMCSLRTRGTWTKR